MKQTDSKGLQAKRTRVTILLEQIQTVLLKLVKKICNINCFIHVIFNFYLSGNKTATTEGKHCIDPL